MQLNAGANTITKVGYINLTVYIASLSHSRSLPASLSLSRSVCGHPHASHNSIKHCPEPEEVEAAAEEEKWRERKTKEVKGAKDKRAKLKPQQRQQSKIQSKCSNNLR